MLCLCWCLALRLIVSDGTLLLQQQQAPQPVNLSKPSLLTQLVLVPASVRVLAVCWVGFASVMLSAFIMTASALSMLCFWSRSHWHVVRHSRVVIGSCVACICSNCCCNYTGAKQETGA